jgi:CBS domain-containing protein
MIRKIVPDVIDKQTLYKVGPRDTVRTAKLMRKIAAVLVIDGDRLVGIVTERDMTARVVASGVNPETTAIADVMTSNPDTLAPNDTASDAIRMMIGRNYRHLPVVEGTRVIGMVSVRDLYAVYNGELEQDLKDRDAYIYGERYGSMA